MDAKFVNDVVRSELARPPIKRALEAQSQGDGGSLKELELELSAHVRDGWTAHEDAVSDEQQRYDEAAQTYTKLHMKALESLGEVDGDSEVRDAYDNAERAKQTHRDSLERIAALQREVNAANGRLQRKKLEAFTSGETPALSEDTVPKRGLNRLLSARRQNKPDPFKELERDLQQRRDAVQAAKRAHDRLERTVVDMIGAHRQMEMRANRQREEYLHSSGEFPELTGARSSLERVDADLRQAFAIKVARPLIDRWLEARPGSDQPTELPQSAPRDQVASPERFPIASGDARMTIFVVHGHDETTKLQVTRFLETVTDSNQVAVVILHEQVNRGRTIIEKFQEHAQNTSYAVVLLTPDDTGGKLGGPQQHRARQNVVFELGYFYGLLGREFVSVITKGDVEDPSDVAGITSISFDEQWKEELRRELKDASIPLVN